MTQGQLDFHAPIEPNKIAINITDDRLVVTVTGDMSADEKYTAEREVAEGMAAMLADAGVHATPLPLVEDHGPLTVCPCGCGWHDASGESSAIMARALACTHDGARTLEPGWRHCAVGCSHWLLTPEAAKRARVHMPRALYRVEEG